MRRTNERTNERIAEWCAGAMFLSRSSSSSWSCMGQRVCGHGADAVGRSVCKGRALARLSLSLSLSTRLPVPYQLDDSHGDNERHSCSPPSSLPLLIVCIHQRTNDHQPSIALQRPRLRTRQKCRRRLCLPSDADRHCTAVRARLRPRVRSFTCCECLHCLPAGWVFSFKVYVQ